MASKEVRLRVFQRRLTAVTPARSFDEAYGQFFRLLNEVEDELHDKPFNPSAAPGDNRLYPPLWDYIFPLPARRARRLDSVGHYTVIGDNGAISIYDKRSGQMIFAKAGSDGLMAEDL